MNTESKSSIRFLYRFEYFVAWLIGLLGIIQLRAISDTVINLYPKIIRYLESNYPWVLGERSAFILVFIVWSVCVLLLYIRIGDAPRRSSYFIIWLIGLFLYLVLRYIIQPATLPLYSNIIKYLENSYLFALVGWSTFILILWTAIGDTSNFHNNQFRRYRSIWIAFSVAVLALFSAFYVYYIGVNEHVQALRGEALLLENIISSNAHTNKSSTTLEYWTSKAISHTNQLSSTLSMSKIISSNIILDLHEDIHQLAGLTRLADRTTQELIIRQGEITKTKGITFAPLQPIITELVTTTEEITQTFQQITQTFSTLRRNPQINDTEPLSTAQIIVSTQLVRELLGHFEQAQLLINNAQATLLAGSVNLASLFILIGILYALFLLFPWLLLFLFLFRNLDFQANSKQKTLKKLGLERTYLEKRQRKDNMLSAREIADDAFRNREYVVGLLLLTTITGIMWHFVWYPLGWSGLAQAITQGYSVKELTDYLTYNASTLTLGFIGAYFFVIQMLFRRYLAADLNPKPYINATVRMTIIFVLCLVLNTMDAWSIFGLHLIYPVAFLAGIFPMPVLQWIIHYVAEKTGWFKDLNVIRGPLTDLDGINIWHEERLMEEGVENIQNLALAALDELIVHTNFSPTQLVHWIDQALLDIQVGDRWRGQKGCFHNVGILTATDLCSVDSGKLAKSVRPIIRQSYNKDDPQKPLPEETEATIQATIETMQTVLRNLPNYLLVKRFWKILHDSADGKEDSQALALEDIEATIITVETVSFL